MFGKKSLQKRRKQSEIFFLITDHNRDGEHEYYDKVAIETKMTVKEFNSNKDFWQECFLAWQFGLC